MNFDPRVGRRASELRYFSRHLLASAAVVALVLGQAASANPAGGTVTSGKATIGSPSAGTLQIDQSTKIVIINWNSFNIAGGETTKFVQPGASSIAVNRIGGNDPSKILGSLLANGKVVLINGNGVLFGPGSKINVGSLIATTSDASDADIAAGKATFNKAGNPNAQIVNQGNITAASGGLVGLIAPAVSNSGVIAAKLGTVTLGASNVFTLDFNGDGLVSFPVDGNVVAAAIDKSGKPVEALVVNNGKISGGTVMLTARAAANLVTNVISMKGVVVATAAHQVGGKVVLDGGQSGDVSVAGTIDASGTSGGSISVVSQGTTSISGTITAKNSTGTGGSIETSGHNLSIAGTVDAGQGGSWLLDPYNLTINATAAKTIDTALAKGTNTTLQTTATGTSGAGTKASGSGDIIVASSLNWTGTGTLTLDAYRNVTVNTGVTIKNTGSGSLVLYADHGAKDSGVVTFSGTSKVNWSGSTGNVTIYYHPSSYGTTTSFSSHVTLHSGSKLTSYMTVDKAADLQNINQNLKGTYALNADISASSLTKFVPIGLDSTGSVANSNNGFTGVFDGQNHTIDKLKVNITSNSSAYSGLFAYVGAGGVVRNVGLTNVAFTDTGPGIIIGPLVGKNLGTVSNSYSTGTVTADESFIGGLVGSNRGTISSSHSSVKITLKDSSGYGHVYLGGLVEYNAGTISSSYATGSISVINSDSPNNDVGGLVGYNVDGKISGSYATGAVTANGAQDDVGGLVGASFSLAGASIVSSYATGKVTSVVTGGGDSAEVGGLVGYIDSATTVKSSHASGAVTVGRNSYAGGLVGYNAGGSISSSYATGAVTGGSSSSVGGLVGTNYASGKISSSYAKGAVKGGTASSDGGLVGYNSGTITKGTAYGTVTGGSSSFVGGFVGLNDGGTISGCSAVQTPLVGYENGSTNC